MTSRIELLGLGSGLGLGLGDVMVRVRVRVRVRGVRVRVRVRVRSRSEDGTLGYISSRFQSVPLLIHCTLPHTVHSCHAGSTNCHATYPLAVTLLIPWLSGDFAGFATDYSDSPPNPFRLRR